MAKRIYKDTKELRIRILAVTTAVMMLATGFKMIYVREKKNELERENALLRQEFQDLLDEELRISHENMKNNENYVVNDEMEIDGVTVKIVSEPTPIPTITPTPTPEPVYSRYINTSSDEFIGAEDGIYHETEPKVVLDFYSVNEMITFYSYVFQLDDQKVGDKIYELIELDEEAWNEENILNGKQYDSKEQAIARTIADISNFPGNYGLSDIEVDEYKLSQYKPEELIYKFAKVIGVNEKVALAVACGESGTKLDSYNFQTRYNVGGLRIRTGDPHPTTSWGLVIYKNPAEGLYRFIVVLHDNFFVDENSGYDRIKAMSYSYCEEPAYWRNLVGSLYWTLEDKGYDYYYNKYRWDRDLVYTIDDPEKVI